MSSGATNWIDIPDNDALLATTSLSLMLTKEASVQVAGSGAGPVIVMATSVSVLVAASNVKDPVIASVLPLSTTVDPGAITYAMGAACALSAIRPASNATVMTANVMLRTTENIIYAPSIGSSAHILPDNSRLSKRSTVALGVGADLMPVVVREEIRNLERELGNQAALLIRLLQTRPLETGTEGAKPGQAWPDPKAMGITCGSESDIQLAVEKMKAVSSVIKKTRSATGAKMAEPKSQPSLSAQQAPKAIP